MHTADDQMCKLFNLFPELYKASQGELSDLYEQKYNKMNFINFKKVFIRVSAAFALLFAIVVLQSCGGTQYSFLTSTVVPAAEGSVKVKKDKNNNYGIDLHVKRLADPQRLSPAKAMYIVWMETEQSGRKNIGQLKTSSGRFSSMLTSSLKTVASFKPTGFFITAEDNANILYPVGQTVLSTEPL